ncbi:MAG: hypothetical protein OQL28_15395 [Sedimenticola sp.]|nr:hypothetical protein [Sedimenticola sp.]
MFVFHEDGSEAEPLTQLVEGFLRSKEVGDELVKQATDEHKWFALVKLGFVDCDGRSVFLEKIEPKVYRKVERLYIEGTCEFEYTRFPLRHASLGDISVSWGSAKLDRRETLLVVSPTEEGETKLTISIREKGN